MTTENYVGQELDLFARAENWKRYWSAQIEPFLGESVLEVGAGIGASTEIFKDSRRSSWVCLEPDPALAKRIAEKIERGDLPKYCTVSIGTIADLPAEARFDSIVYIDVLEHIQNDRDELARAARLLHPQGTLVVLAPAHQYLFSPFDESIGHFRRYSRRSLLDLMPGGLTVRCSRYLDSVGMCASLANKLLLKKPLPSERDIRLWDKRMVPISRVLDPIFGYSVGRSVFAVWAAS
jgi:2-polyprenyl-3-methyl-5-hydroxy-6-metoxy-1,4-benzoquinol methylase